MPTFYIVPPRKTQLGEFGISISGIFGIKTNLPNNAPITSAGALQLDQGFEPTWTGQHIFNNIVTFNDNVIFNGDQSFNINSLYIAGQTAGDLIYFNGTTWTRQGISTTSGAVLQSTGTSITWSNALNVGTTTTNTLNIGSLNGVLKASSGLVSGSSGLNDLQDVQLSSPSNNQFLKYNAGLSKWQNANVPLPDRTLIIRFLNGSTPVTLGADQEIATVPYEPSDGVSVLIFLVTRITLQIENTASSGDSTIRVQRVNANTAFPDPTDPSAVFIAELTVPAGDTEVFINRTDPSFDVSVSSGQRLRLVIDEIGTGAENWTVQLEGSAVSLYEQPSGVVPISMGGTGRSTIGAANTLLTVGQDADKLIYKQLVAGTSISIVSAPVLSEGVEVGGTITVSYTGAGGGGTGTVNSGNAGELTYYASTGTTVSGINNLLWNNVGKKLSITAVPSTWDTSAISLLIGTSTFANGSANGTVIGVNVPSTPVFTGNFIDLQLNNSSKFSVDYTGAISASTISLTSTSASTSTTTGALVVPGGVGIGGALNLGTALSVSNGGTGVTTATSGQLLIGNSSGTFTKSTLTGSNGISITNGDGSITISNDRLNSLNGLTTTSQTFATSTSGTDFTITSSTSTHTFALPDASTTARGVISTTAQTIGGLKTFNNGAKSQEFITGLSGYFGGDPAVFTVGGTTGSVLFGIMKDDSLSRFAGIKVEEKVSPTLGSGYLYGDIVFYTDSEAEDFSTERMRIDGAGTITMEGDVSIDGTLTLNNVPLSPAYGGTGNTSYTDGQLLIGNSSTGSLTKSTLTAGTNVTITNGNGTITISASTGGTVTSVGLSMPSIFVVNTSTITSSGTFTVTLETTSANYVFAGPTTGSATTPAFRALVATDIPSLNYAPLTSGTSILSGNGSGGFSSVTIGTGLSFSAGTLSNSAPDQTVSLSTGNANVTITGTYPNFTISSVNTTYTNGTGINLVGTTFSIDNTVVATLSDNQNLSNKTLTSPVINSATLNTTTIGSSGLIITGTTSGTSYLVASASPSGNTITFPASTGTLAITNDIKDGTLSLGVSGNGLSGSASFSANTSSAITFTVTSNATSANTINTLVYRDGSGNFSAGTITATLSGNATNVNGTVAIANGGTGGTTVTEALTNLEGTTVGINIFKLTNPNATTFIRINSNNTVDTLSASNFRTAIGAGTGDGTVTSVGLSVPSILSASTSSITSSGTFTITLTSQNANYVFAGPTTGAATTPTFRALVSDDIPALNYAPQTTGTSILYGNGSGGFSNVTVGTGLSFSTGTLSNSAPDQTVSLSTGNANVTITGTYPNFTIATNDTTYTDGTGIILTGTSFSIDTSTVVTLNDSQILTNKTITGTSNTLTVRLANDVTGTLPVANGGTGTVNGSITGTGALTFTATGTSSNITLTPGSSAFVDVSSKKIINLANPDNDQDAATKGYVDSVSQGLVVKDSVRVASTANLTASYSNGTDGVGATLTNSGSQAALSIDNVSLNYLDRVLVKDQSTQLQNGIYYIASTSHIGSATTNWVLTRTTDADEDSEVTSGLFVFVTSGDTNSATGWVMSSSGAIDVGTSSIVFSQFSGNTTYTDLDPITINGTVISLNNGNPLPVNHGGTGVNFSASSGILKFTTGTASLVTAPAGDIVGTSDSQTLTNKTLTSPTLNTAIIGSAGITLNGTTGTTKIVANSTAGNNTITLSTNSGTVVTTGDTGTVTSTMIANGTIVNADISGSAAIAISKLAASTISGVSLGNNLNSLSTSAGGGLTISSTSYNGSTSGTITVDTTVVATLSSSQTLQNKTLNSPVVDSIYDLLSSSLTTSSTTSDQIFHSISATTYRSVKYFVQITSGSSYHVVEIVLVHDGTSVIISEYGRVMTGSSLSTFDADISGGNLRLKVTPTNAITDYRAAATAMRS